MKVFVSIIIFMQFFAPSKVWGDSIHLAAGKLLQKDQIISGILPSSFGKTHFILGVDPEKILQLAPEPVCKAQEGDIASLLICKDGSIKQALFSPDDDVAGVLMHLIMNEQTCIKAAIFSFTDGDIAKALIEAKNRGVIVEVIADASYLRDKYTKIALLKENGITICVYNPNNKAFINDIMHNKFVLFSKNIHDKALLWTGSFNFTKSARLKNQENVLILDEAHLIEKYLRQFDVIKKRIANPDDPTIKVARRTTRKKRSKREPIDKILELTVTA